MTNVPQSIGKYSRQEIETMFSKTFTDYEWYVLQDGIDLDNLEYSTLVASIQARVVALDEIVAFYEMYEPMLDKAKKEKEN